MKVRSNVSEIVEEKDEDLVLRILEHKDRNAVSLLYDRYAKRVYSRCLSIAKNKETAKDLMQDTMLIVFTKLKELRNPSLFSFWLFKITTNTCLSYLKRNDYKLFRSNSENEDYEDQGPQELAIKNLHELRLSNLEQAMGEIKPAEKLILLMHYQDELSVKEIAERLEIGLSSVKMKLKRSRDKLAKILNEEYE